LNTYEEYTFAGSGVIFAATQETGRVAFGVEIEPHVCGKIVERLEQKYRLKAKVLGNVFVIGAGE
jgi:DNA modification methylase